MFVENKRTCPGVERLVRWALPLLVACAASSCGSSSSGAPVDTPQASADGTSTSTPVSVPTALTDPQSVGTTGPTPPASVPDDPSTTTTSLAIEQRPDSIPPTTAPVLETVPATYAPLIGELPVLALAAALGVEGEVEQLDGEHGPGYCVGPLEPRGFCVNVPLWGLWQYWDLDAQNGQGATDEEAAAVALDLFARLGVDAGEVESVERSGPLPKVALSGGASVIVAQDGRIAMVYSSTTLMPPG